MVEIDSRLGTGKGLYPCCGKPIAEFSFGSLQDEHGNCYKGEFDDFVRHGAGIIELNDGNIFIGNFCNNLLMGRASFVVGKTQLKVCFFFPIAPFDSRVLKLITKAEGTFIRGVANGSFKLYLKSGRYTTY